MAARAIWKASVRLGTDRLPVKLYSAVQDRSVHFRLLDARRKEPVKQQMVDPNTGDVVEPSEIRRAIEAGDGDLVILSDDELSTLIPAESREIEIIRFVPAGSIGPEWYDRPYFLGPDGMNGKYFALAEALRRQSRVGVARWVMRKKEYAGALRPEGDHLALITLRFSGEVVPVSSLRPPAGRDLSPRELQMAEQLVTAMQGELDLASFRDEHRDRVMELVEAKEAGKVVRLPTRPKKKAEKPLADALERSIAALRKERASA